VKGFAIGRTIFLKPLQDLLSGTITEEAAKRTIADNFLHFIKLWEANA
jgi:myo-inositol catabolism protein IolC